VWERGKKKEERRKLIGKTEVIKVKYICIKGDNVFRQERFVSKYSIRIADGGNLRKNLAVDLPAVFTIYICFLPSGFSLKT
jgi:hypothetical protein